MSFEIQMKGTSEANMSAYGDFQPALRFDNIMISDAAPADTVKSLEQNKLQIQATNAQIQDIMFRAQNAHPQGANGFLQDAVKLDASIFKLEPVALKV